MTKIRRDGPARPGADFDGASLPPEGLFWTGLMRGDSRVRLNDVGPPAGRATFWLGTLAWPAAAGIGAGFFVSYWRLARTPTSVQST